MRKRVLVFLAGVLVTSGLAAPVTAAEFTDLVDAADDMDDLVEETYDPFDFTIEPTFRFDTGTATITREATCVPSEDDLVGDASRDFENRSPRLEVNPRRCDEPRVVDNNEMSYRHQRALLNTELKAGIYKDLEFHINVPYVFSDVAGMAYANEVDAGNSSVDPSDERIQRDADNAFGDGSDGVDRLDFYSTYRFFNLGDDYDEIQRSGFADPSIGLHWGPFNDARDDTKATLVLGMDWVLPLAPVKSRENADAVGKGLHELQWKIASSKRFDVVEPYFGIQYFLPLPAPRSPIQQVDASNNGQVFIAPPQRGEITIGSEFIPYDEPEEGARYAIDLQFKFGYTSEGRDYTPLFDHMVNSDCQGKSLQQVLPQYDDEGNLESIGDVECAWIARQPSNAPVSGGNPDPIYDLSGVPADEDPDFNYDGIMTVGSYGTFAGKVGFILQPSHYFKLKAHAALTHVQEHFLTNARTGRDVADDLEETGDPTVDLEGPDAALERNPVFNPSYDSNGNRFRIQEFNTWSFFVSASLMF